MPRRQEGFACRCTAFGSQGLFSLSATQLVFSFEARGGGTSHNGLRDNSENVWSFVWSDDNFLTLYLMMHPDPDLAGGCLLQMEGCCGGDSAQVSFV